MTKTRGQRGTGRHSRLPPRMADTLNTNMLFAGMILELGPDPVHHILESPTDLKKAVYKATKALTAG